jgi:MFS family permease
MNLHLTYPLRKSSPAYTQSSVCLAITVYAHQWNLENGAIHSFSLWRFGSGLFYNARIELQYLLSKAISSHSLTQTDYDVPAALSEPLRLHLSLSKSQYSYLVSAMYTAYSAPNIILPLFCGALVQRFGENRVLYATLICVVLGQLIFSLGVDSRQVWVIIFGRIILGLGGETLGVLSNNITMRWFS